MDFLIYIVGFFAIVWFFLINPQRKKEKQRQDLIRSMEVGDKVTTLGGIFGVVAGIKDRSFLLQVADGVVIEMSKHSIASVRDYDDDDDINQGDEEEKVDETEAIREE